MNNIPKVKAFKTPKAVKIKPYKASVKPLKPLKMAKIPTIKQAKTMALPKLSAMMGQ